MDVFFSFSNFFLILRYPQPTSISATLITEVFGKTKYPSPSSLLLVFPSPSTWYRLYKCKWNLNLSNVNALEVDMLTSPLSVPEKTKVKGSSSKLFYLQKDEQLVKNLKSKLGSNVVLILGDRSAPNAKYHEPIRNKGLIKLLKESFKKIKNARPFQREKMPTVLCDGLLKCTNHASKRFFNRDMAAALNFRNILLELRKTGERPESLRRSTTGKRKQNSNDSNNRTAKKKTKSSA